MTPSAQTARRVCVTAAGYTEGVATADGARLFHGRAVTRRVVADAPLPARDQDRTYERSRADVLLRVLRSCEPVIELAKIARALGIDDVSHATTRVEKALTTLARRGEIVWWRGADHKVRGQHAVRIVATGQVLRTAGCPAGVP